MTRAVSYLFFFGSLFFLLAIVMPQIITEMAVHAPAEETQKRQKSCIFLLLGPPSSGHGVLIVKLARVLHIPHVSPDGLLFKILNETSGMRQKAQEYLTNHQCLPNYFIMEMLEQYLKESTESSESSGCFLDNIPSNIEQAIELTNMLPDNCRLVPIYLAMPDEAVILQEGGRLICKQCGTVYHSVISPPEELMTCDNCLTSLTQREDDTKEVVQKRLKKWHTEIDPILSHFRKEGTLKEIKATGSFDSIFSEIKEYCIEQLYPEQYQ